MDERTNYMVAWFLGVSGILCLVGAIGGDFMGHPPSTWLTHTGTAIFAAMLTYWHLRSVQPRQQQDNEKGAKLGQRSDNAPPGSLP